MRAIFFCLYLKLKFFLNEYKNVISFGRFNIQTLLWIQKVLNFYEILRKIMFLSNLSKNSTLNTFSFVSIIEFKIKYSQKFFREFQINF